MKETKRYHQNILVSVVSIDSGNCRYLYWFKLVLHIHWRRIISRPPLLLPSFSTVLPAIMYNPLPSFNTVLLGTVKRDVILPGPQRCMCWFHNRVISPSIWYVLISLSVWYVLISPSVRYVILTWGAGTVMWWDVSLSTGRQPLCVLCCFLAVHSLIAVYIVHEVITVSVPTVTQRVVSIRLGQLTVCSPPTLICPHPPLNRVMITWMNPSSLPTLSILCHSFFPVVGQ